MRSLLRSAWALPVLCVLGAGVSLSSAGLQAPVATYTALAVNPDGAPGATTATVEINIQRWSTDAERDTIIAALAEAGQDKLLDVMAKMPSIGRLSTPTSVGYDLKYASREMTNGNERILAITDRPIGFGENYTLSRSRDYPFTVIQISFGAAGRGEGELSVATKIGFNKRTKTLMLENFGTTPAKLTTVKKVK